MPNSITAVQGLRTLPDVQHVVPRQDGAREVVVARRGRQGYQTVDLRGEGDRARQLGSVLGQPADQLGADAALQDTDSSNCRKTVGDRCMLVLMERIWPPGIWQAT